MAKQIIDQPLDSGNANTNSVDKNNNKPTRNNKVVKPIDALKNSRNIEAIQTTANYENAKKEFAKASHGMIHKKYADAQSAIEDGKAYREAYQNFQESRLKYNKDKDEEEYLKAGGDSIDINYNTKRLDEISKEEKELRSRVSELSNKLNDINGTLSNEEQIELANINKQLSEMNSEEEKLQKELSVAKNHLENVAYDKAVQEGNQEEADYYADIIRARDYNFGETVGMAIGKSIANIAQYAAVLAHVLKDNALENAANNLDKTYKESLEKGEISQETFDRAMEMTKQWQDYDAMKQPFVQSIREDQKKLDAMLNSAYSHDGVVERFIEQGISSSADFLVKYGLFKGGTTAVFGLQSYTERYAELSEAVDENGNPLYTKEQIEKNAVWTGLASYLTEKIGMDSFAKILTGGASKYIYGHAFDYLFKSLVQQGLAEGSEEIIEALADGIIDSITLGTPIEYNAGDIFYSFVLGAFSGVLMGAGASVSFTVSTTQQYNTLKNDIDTLKGLRKKATSQEEIQKIDNAIFVGENALNNFEEKSKLGLAVNMQNDNINQNSTTQEVEAEMAEAITPNVEEAFETANQIENVVSNITNVSKQLLLQKGIDMNVNQYVELSQEEKNDVNKLSENFNKAIKHINLGFDTSAPVNGYILSSKNGKPTIIVNPKSPTLGGTLTTVSTVYELVRSIENTDEYKKIVSLLDQDKLKAKTNELSKGLYRGADSPQNEAVAKELSENIIDSNDFIEHLAKYNTSFAYKVLYKLRGAIEILGDSDQSERITRELTKALSKQTSVEKGQVISDSNKPEFYSYENLTRLSPLEIKTYVPSNSNASGVRKAVWENLGENKMIKNDILGNTYLVNSNTITNSRLYSPGGYTLLENIADIFKSSIPINKTENIDEKSKRKGNKYTVFFNEFSDGKNIYLAKIITEDESSNRNFTPNVHKVKSIDIAKIDKNNIEKRYDSQASVSSKGDVSLNISVEQLLDDVNRIDEWKGYLSDDIYKRLNNGEERAYEGKDQSYKKLAFTENEEDTIENKIYNSMSMDEARRMLEKAWNRLKEYVDYSTLDEYLKEEPGIAYDELALQIENNEDLTDEYINSNNDILNEEYTINDVINAYKNGKLKKDSKSFEIKPIDFGQGIKQEEKLYTPKTIDNPVEIYEIANQRINNNNRNEVLKARGDIIVYSHSPNALETLGLTKAELNKKIHSWSNYSAKAKEISQYLNNGVPEEYRWSGLENSNSINKYLNYKNVDKKEMLKSLVKDVNGTFNDAEASILTNVMLSIDSYIDYSQLTIYFDVLNEELKNRGALGTYSKEKTQIDVGDAGVGTLAHETGHFIDNLWAREISQFVGVPQNGYLSDLFYHNLIKKNNSEHKYSNWEKINTFLDNYKSFIDILTNKSDIRSEYTQSRTEVFARFVDYFNAWVNKTASGYGESRSYYNDNFNVKDCYNFVKLLQQKSMLDATVLNSIKNNPDQVKLANNTNPTSNNDIRFSLIDNNDKNVGDIHTNGEYVQENAQNVLTSKNNAVNNVSEYKATIAPYLNTKLTEKNYNELLSKVEETYTKTANEIANALGIDYVGKTNNVGGYTFNDGTPIKEISFTNTLNTDYEKAKLFTCLMGDLAYENQETVIVSNYVSENEDANVLEFGVKYKNQEQLERTLEELGINDYTIDKDNKTVRILDFDFNENNQIVLDLIEKMGDNYEGYEVNRAQSELIEREDRRNIYEAWLNSKLGEQDRSDSNISEEEQLIRKALDEVNKAINDNAQESAFIYNLKDQQNTDIVPSENIENNNTGSQETEPNEEYPVGFSRALGQNIEAEYQRNLNKYGAFEPGEEPRQDIKVPKATDYGKTSQFARNYAEAPNLTNEESILDFAESINNGLFSYVESTNKEKVDDANKKLDRIGIEKMYEEVMNNSNITPRLIAEESVVLRKLSAKNDSRTTQLAIKMANDATAAAQTLQAFQILKRLTPEGQLSAAYQSMQRMQAKLDAKYGNKAPTLQISDDLAEKLRTAKTNEEIDRARKDIADSLAEQVPSSFSDQIRAWRYLSMLGNPTTHIRNFLGSALFAPLVNVKNSIGAVLEDVTDKALKATKKQGLEYKTKSILNPFSQKYKDLYKAGEEEYDFVKSSIEKNHKYEQQSFSKKTWLGRALNKVSNINSLALDKEDFIFTKARFADSYAQFLNANGLDPKTISADMQHKANAYAMREAQKATYRDFNSVADWLNKLEYSTQKGLRMASFVKDAVVPFTRTPMNIVKRGMEYSPIGLAKTILYDSSQLYQNKITVNDYIDNLSSGLTGTGIVLIGALLKGLGIFRTKDDDPSRKQNFDKDNGEQDYSIDLSPLGLNGTYTIDWMAPEIMPLAMGAELYDVFSGLQNSNGKNVIDAVADVSARLMDPVMETTMLSSLKQTLSSYANSGGEWFGDMVGSVVSSYISQFFPTVGGKIARAIDETRRTTYPNSGLIDKTIKTIANKIPFASMTNQPYINTSGQETKNTGGNFFGRLAFNLLSPGNYSNKELDKYDEEIYRLYNSTGDINAFPSNKSNSTTYDKEKYDLSESDYTKFNKTRLSLEDKYVKEFIDSASYEDYTDEEKVETLKDIRKYALDSAKEQYLKGEGVNYNDKWYTKANEAINNKKIDVVDYFDYLNREGTNQTETVKYLESTSLTKKQKEYLYSQNNWKTSYEDAYSKVFGKSKQKANNTGDSFFSQRR